MPEPPPDRPFELTFVIRDFETDAMSDDLDNGFVLYDRAVIEVIDGPLAGRRLDVYVRQGEQAAPWRQVGAVHRAAAVADPADFDTVFAELFEFLP